MRVGVYSRYSSNLQSAASIDDQVRVCREHAKLHGWNIVETYSDAAMSGASILRPGLQAALAAARRGDFDVLLAEALDRISRDQEDVAGIYKRLNFAGVTLFTLSEGEIGPLHVGLKGTMNALFLKDLADKTRRGMRGKLEKGNAVAGRSYGYRVIAVGKREIDEAEASVVRRIFEAYGKGLSPRTIAKALNSEKIPGPGGRLWGPSTIIGNRYRGIGILNNELYVGVIVWNRQRFIKDPDTRKRLARLNPPENWIRVAVPGLRVIDDAHRIFVLAILPVVDRLGKLRVVLGCVGGLLDRRLARRVDREVVFEVLVFDPLFLREQRARHEQDARYRHE